MTAACGGTKRLPPIYEIVQPTRRPEPAYEAMFPHYVELCAVSQFRRRDGKTGGIPGHAVMYLKGACVDRDAPYPTLERCLENTVDPEDQRHGAGISVNRIFKNVNWMAVPGKRLLLDGDLAPDERLTQERYDAIEREAIELGVFRGIEVHERFLEDKDPGVSLEEFIADRAIGTDFALRLSRTAWCTRLPVTQPMIVEIMEYLNEMNRQYATGEADYDWSGYHDNCVHLLHNALAAADVWKPKSIRVIKLRQMFNLAVPANAVIDLGWRSVSSPLEDPDKLRRDTVSRESLATYGWVAGRHGALIKSLPIHQDNDLFETRVRILLFGKPIRSGAARKSQELLADARFSELETNLRYYRARYRVILDGLDERPAAGTVEERRFVKRYREYLERELADVSEKLEALPGLRAELGRR